MNNIPKIYLKRGKETPLLRMHPWVFSGAIDILPDKCKDGDVVAVYSQSRNFLAIGHYSPGSIAVRIISFEPVSPDSEFWNKKISEAFELRTALGLTNSPLTNSYRLIHGEGDGLPGLIVDIYNKTAVIQAHSAGMFLARKEIASALTNVLKNQITTVFDKSTETLSKSSGLNAINKALIGTETDSEISENGLLFKINIPDGQKTGFFIDQRDNRALLHKYSDGKKILNTFCYTGGFTIAALKGGAAFVHSVDSSKKAIEITKENILLNNFDQEKNQCIEEDTLVFLKKCETSYDIIILDPPAYAKHLSAKHNAVQGYKRLNAEAMKKINKGGLLFTFSCSQVIDKKLFADTVTAAAIESGRSLKILHQMTQAPDHPVSIFHPEGEYLKGLVLYID